jgi:hypothetical protein
VSEDQLRFDRVESPSPAGGVACASCGRAIEDVYYSGNGRTFCAACRTGIEAALASGGRFGPGLLLGLGGAILGGTVYFAVTAISGYELSLITILIGWLVGRGLQKGSGVPGGRRYQVAAVVLTYLAVAGAYLALGLRQGLPEGADPARLVFVSLRLPVAAGLADPPGSLLGLLIIGIGLYQAWQMTRRPVLTLSGPFRIAGPAPTAE